MLCISVHLLPLCIAVLWRIKLDCSWWDCIDGMCLFLQILFCASPIYAHSEASADKPSSGWYKMERHPTYPLSPGPALMAAEATHICHSCGLLPFCAVSGEMSPGSGAWEDALQGMWWTRVGWCLPESWPTLSHLPSPLGHRTLHPISLQTIYHLWACL